MGLTRFPPQVRIALAVVAAVVIAVTIGVLAVGRSGGSGTAGATPTYIPTDRDLTENPDAILKKQDLEAAFAATFRLYQENPIKAQGVQYNFTETNGKFTVSVLEVKGEEAAATWQRLTTTFTYPDAPNISRQAKLKPDLIVAVFKGGVFVSVTLTGGMKPTDGAALQKLGTLANKQIPA